jgi:hypothetical protein
MVAHVSLAMSPRLQPGEHDQHYSHGERESTHSGKYGRACHAPAPLLYSGVPMSAGLAFNRLALPCRGLLGHTGSGRRLSTRHRRFAGRPRGEGLRRAQHVHLVDSQR